MYKKETGNDKQGKDAGNRALCQCRNFSQAIMLSTAFVVSSTQKIFRVSDAVECSDVSLSTGNNPGVL